MRVSCLPGCLGDTEVVLPAVILIVPNLSVGADRVGGQLRGDKECPFNGVIKSGRVWRKVPESDARHGRHYARCVSLPLQSLSSERGNFRCKVHNSFIAVFVFIKSCFP